MTFEHRQDAVFPEKAPLEGCTSFTCSHVEEAEAIVADIFCAHDLRPKGAISRLSKFRMNHVKFGKSSSLNYLRYGNEVSVEPGEMEQVFNVQLQIAGATKTICGKTESIIQKGCAGVLSPTKYVTMDWSEDAAMLIYSVSRKSVEQKLQAILGNHLCDPVIFDAHMDCADQAGSAFWRALKFLQIEIETSDHLLNSPMAVEHFEQSLILSLLYGQKHNYSRALTHGVSMAAPIHVKRVEEYIRANAHERITIEDLTAVSGVSARTLFSGFKSFRGISPMKFLRNHRMDLVRNDIQNAQPHETITEIAMKWGFTQLGRFSVEYKKKFGEKPSETLRAHLLRSEVSL